MNSNKNVINQSDRRYKKSYASRPSAKAMNKNNDASTLSFLSLSLIFSTMMIFLASLFVYKSYVQQNKYYSTIVSVEQTLGKIFNHQEARASAIQLSISTGHAKYKQTYDIYSTPLDKLLTSLKSQTLQTNTFTWDVLEKKLTQLKQSETKAFELIKDKNISQATDIIFDPKYQNLKIISDDMLQLLANDTKRTLQIKIEDTAMKMTIAGMIIGTTVIFLLLVTLHTNKLVNAWKKALQKSYSQTFQSKQAERNSLRLLESIKNTTSDGIVILNSKGDVINSNPAARELVGMDSEIMHQAHFSQLFIDSCTALIEDEFELLEENGTFSLFQKEVTLVTKSQIDKNNNHSVNVTIAPVTHSDQLLLQVRMKDITQQISQQNQMVDSMKDAKYASAYLKSLLLNCPDAIIITNDIGDIELFNPASEKLFGYTFDEIAGKKFKELFDIANINNNPFEEGSNIALGLNKNGERFQISLTFSEFITDEGVFYTSFIRHGNDSQKWIQEQKTDTSSLASAPIRVLVAEDNPINLTLTTHVMQSMGYEVTPAEDGKSLLKILTSGKEFDTIFISTHVPDIDGFKLTRLIRNYEKENNKTQNTIIGLIASIDSDTIMSCLESGMSDYCHKPLDKASLRNKTVRKESKQLNIHPKVA